MSLDNIIVFFFILGAIGALVAVNLHSRRKNKKAESDPESPQ